MKKILIGIAILFVQVSFAQVSKELGEFSEIKVFDQLSVQLIQSSTNKIDITGDRSDEVEVVNKNGQLKIRMPFPKLLSGNNMSIKLYYKRIERIDVNEGSIAHSKETFKQTAFEVSAQEGARVEVNLEVDKVKVTAVSGGIVNISGSATNQSASLGAGGILEAKNLLTSQTAVSVSAGGHAEVNASILVDAKVSAGGSIYIYGKPEQINKKTVLGGRIEEK
ncbi:head GIN domain-containing protein [Flavobacterium sp. TAB 87]|uniref:head GIN domain-containing protein n=1 Tax=Flavobacterium sp. TAB 87 TaxID=1729581 RepID=UPI00076DF3E3|nr:head GIN domain-containing protein [Flavobacterium sp. TAB 87]KVV13473.1 hypothetical protein AP058_02837 [Flavobacterium sp. TAB 87]